MMTDREIDLLTQRIVFHAMNSDELIARVSKAMQKNKKPEKKLISLKKAAEMLGISHWQLYRIKDDASGRPQFSYVKTGTAKSSTVKFNAATIHEEYERYLASRKINKDSGEVVELARMKVAAG